MAQYPRFKQNLNVTLILPDNSTLTGNTASLSTEGANLIVGHAIKTGASCLLEIELKEAQEQRFKICTEVTSCSPLSDFPGFGVGLKFIDPPEHYLSVIDQLNATADPDKN